MAVEVKDELKEAVEEVAEEVEQGKEEGVKEEDEDFTGEREKDLLDAMEFRLNEYDCSFNALCGDGAQLHVLQGDGFRTLVTGMRMTYGIKTGRYYVETKMLEQPASVRLGLDTGGPSDILWLDDENSLCFESGGEALVRGARQPKGSGVRWGRTDLVGMLLNVATKTVDLYINGAKKKTLSIPDEFYSGEELKKPLFPVLASRGTALQCNTSRKVWKPLPFVVRPIGLARKADVEESERTEAAFASKRAKDDKAMGITKKMRETLNQENTVEVILPIGLDTKEYIDQYAEKNPDVIVLTAGMLTKWGEKSGRKGTTACLDAPIQVFPLVLKGGRKYLLSLSNFHNLHPAGRKDLIQKLNHGSSARVYGKLLVDNLCDTVEEGKPVLSGLREHYKEAGLPVLEEGFETLEYIHAKLPKESQAKLEEMAEEKFEEWRKDCKLKSKLSDLKKSSLFAENAANFMRVKQMQHRLTADMARKKAVETRAAQKKAIAEAKAKEAKEASPNAEGNDSEEGAAAQDGEEGSAKKEVAGVDDLGEDNATPKEDEESEEEIFPEILLNWQEEDWMLASLRAELHNVITSFVIDAREGASEKETSREGFPVIHLGYYYQLYTNKRLEQSMLPFGVKTSDALLRLVPEIFQHTANLSPEELAVEGELIKDYDILEAALPPATEASVFISITDDARVIRNDRIEAGDEAARLKFAHMVSQPILRSDNIGDAIHAPAPRGKGYGSLNATQSSHARNNNKPWHNNHGGGGNRQWHENRGNKGTFGNKRPFPHGNFSAHDNKRPKNFHPAQGHQASTFPSAAQLRRF